VAAVVEVEVQVEAESGETLQSRVTDREGEPQQAVLWVDVVPEAED
jgi:hypothetical protein